jgi:hypothetical protein
MVVCSSVLTRWDQALNNWVILANSCQTAWVKGPARPLVVDAGAEHRSRKAKHHNADRERQRARRSGDAQCGFERDLEHTPRVDGEMDG